MENANNNDNDNVGAVQVFEAYVGVQHRIMIIMVLIIFGLGFGFLLQANKHDAAMMRYEKLLHEVTELKIENIQLRELSKDKLEKMKRGAQYIEKHYGVERELAERFAIREMFAATKYNVPYSVGLAITAQESSFKPTAVSYTNCCLGPKQINFRVWKEYFALKKREDLFDTDLNIELGYYILNKYRKQSGSLEGALKRYYGSTIPEENDAYAQQVIQRAERIARAINT